MRRMNVLINYILYTFHRFFYFFNAIFLIFLYLFLKISICTFLAFWNVKSDFCQGGFCHFIKGLNFAIFDMILFIYWCLFLTNVTITFRLRFLFDVNFFRIVSQTRSVFCLSLLTVNFNLVKIWNLSKYNFMSSVWASAFNIWIDVTLKISKTIRKQLL